MLLRIPLLLEGCIFQEKKKEISFSSCMHCTFRGLESKLNCSPVFSNGDATGHDVTTLWCISNYGLFLCL